MTPWAFQKGCSNLRKHLMLSFSLILLIIWASFGKGYGSWSLSGLDTEQLQINWQFAQELTLCFIKDLDIWYLDHQQLDLYIDFTVMNS